MNQANYIRFILKEKKLQVKELAKEMGITPTALSMKISGDIKFSQRDINFLLKRLEMKYEELFLKEGETVTLIQVGDSKTIIPSVATYNVESLIGGIKKWQKIV